MNIVLMGYRGTGKTTAGKIMAEELWYEFVDTDDLVCKKFDGATIREIWDQHGEAAFRKAECEALREALAEDDQVIALGGGTVMQQDAMDALQNDENVRCIYLRCHPEELHRRIEADTQTADARPALTQVGGGIEEIEKVLAEREPIYVALAHSSFDVTHTDPKDAVRHIIRACL